MTTGKRLISRDQNCPIKKPNAAFQPQEKGAATLNLTLASTFYPSPSAKSSASASLDFLI